MSELPQGWADAVIADVIDHFVSIDPTSAPGQRFRYVDIGSINNKTQEIADPKSFLGRDAPSRARRVIRTGDTLFSTVRTYLKNIAQVPEELNGELTSTGIEPPRLYRRPQLLRGWGYDEQDDEQVLA